MTSITQQELRQALQALCERCQVSEENLHAASEQMQNRGLKGLFKRFAQQHKRFAYRLEDLAEQMGITLSAPSRFRNSLQRGWMDIRIGMIVGRANRQAAAAARSDASERDLLRMYDQVLQLPLPEFARIEIQEQRDGVQRIHQWLQRAIAQEKWIIRLYDDAAEADQAIVQLKSSGFTEDQIKVTPLHYISHYQDDAEERVHSTVDATLVGTLIGAAIGVTLGLLIGFWRPLYDPAVPATVSVLWISILSSGLIGALVGASIGSFFGFLISQAISEDDASLAHSTPGQNAVIVSVETTARNHTNAARILHMWHEREVENIPV